MVTEPKEPAEDAAALRELSQQRFQQLVDEAPGSCRSQARAANACPSSWSALKSGKLKPFCPDGTLRAAAQRFCAFHGVGPSYVWPECDRLHPVEDVDRYPSAEDLDAQMLSKQRTRLVARSLAGLTPQEEKVLRARFFRDLTLYEVGALLRPEAPLSRERVRQIEGQALRRLYFRNRLLDPPYVDAQVGFTYKPPPTTRDRIFRSRLLRDFIPPERKRRESPKKSKRRFVDPPLPFWQPLQPLRPCVTTGVDIRVEPGGIAIEDEYRQASRAGREHILEKLRSAAYQVAEGPLYVGIHQAIANLESSDFPEVYPRERQDKRTIVIKPILASSPSKVSLR